MIRKWWVYLAVIGGLVWFFRTPLMQWYQARVTGLQAAQDAAQVNGYTTYNSQIYTPPVWQPVLNFFKAGAYVPAGDGTQGGGTPAEYSVQG